MITNKGNEIIAKYMLGQTPEYASYLAIGVGAKPLLSDEVSTYDPSKKSLDFEAFRVPIESKGIVNDTISKDITEVAVHDTNSIIISMDSTVGIRIGITIDLVWSIDKAAFNCRGTVTDVSSDAGTVNANIDRSAFSWVSADGGFGVCKVIVDRLVFKAQLPPDQLYGMTEIGLFPGGNNQLAIGFDSRILLGALPTEAWSVYDGVNTTIEYDPTIINNEDGDIANGGFVKFVNSDNNIYTFADRKQRQEAPRLFNRHLWIAGDMSEFDTDDLDVTTDTVYVTCQNLNINMSKNSTDDRIKVAFSIVANSVTGALPSKTRFRMDFIDSSGFRASARSVFLDSEIDNSYQVLEFAISDFLADPNFAWGSIVSVSIYVETLNASNFWDGSYIALDGIRIDNENTPNPLYGLVAWSQFKNSEDDGLPIIKIENSQGYIEYRMGVSIY